MKTAFPDEFRATIALVVAPSVSESRPSRVSEFKAYGAATICFRGLKTSPPTVTRKYKAALSPKIESPMAAYDEPVSPRASENKPSVRVTERAVAVAQDADELDQTHVPAETSVYSSKIMLIVVSVTGMPLAFKTRPW